MKNIIQFNKLKEEYDNKKEYEKASHDLDYEARCLFDSALYTKSNEKAIKLATDAYELRPDSYEYKTYAISKMDDEIRLFEYEKLFNEVNHKIDVSLDKDTIYKTYNKFEKNSKRYIELEYLYALEKIRNKDYNCIDLLSDIKDKYSEYKFKCKHLIMNIYLILKDYKSCIEQYNKNSDENAIILIPLSYAYLKMKDYKNFVYTVQEIDKLNRHFKKIIIEGNEKKILKCNQRYLYGSKYEIYFGLKEFYELYLNDLEYVNEIKNLDY